MQHRTLHPFIIDVEASGFGSHSYPIEIGVVTDDSEKYCALIQPIEPWTHWDNEAESLHHISRSNLMENGKPIIQVAQELNEILDRKTVYTDGWVVDKPWLLRLFEHAGVDPTFNVCALELIMSEFQMLIWDGTKQAVLEEFGGRRHRASIDAFIVQETFCRTLLAEQSQKRYALH